MRARTFLSLRLPTVAINRRCGTLPAYTVAAIGASAVLLTACTSAPTAHADTEEVAHYRDTGYPISNARSLQTYRVVGPSSEMPWTASVTRPADSFRHPIIVYLPSLGQADDEPNHWVSAWARSDYAVIVIQPLLDDAQVWSTAEARSGDFESVAKARFQPDLMAERIARLSALLGQIRARSLRSEPGLENLDWSAVALAGADLGAYTVQTIATAPADRLAQLSWPVAPNAYLIISPYAARNAPPRERPGVAHSPVLMISSADDIDADGIITDTSLRRLAFDRLGEGDDYYFELASATHRWLGGAITPAAATEPARRPAAPPASTDRRGKQRGSGTAARDAVAPDSDEDDTLPDKNAHTPAARAEAEKARGRAMTKEALSEVSLNAVSTAFLDAYVRRQSAAHSWLGNAASKWLQNGDRLKHR